MSIDTQQTDDAAAIATQSHAVGDTQPLHVQPGVERGRTPDYLPDELDDNPADDYRELSTAAVASLALGVLSPLAIFDWWLGLIPLAGCALGTVALIRIRSHRGEYTGEILAWAGMVLAGLFWVGGIARLSYVYATGSASGL